MPNSKDNRVGYGRLRLRVFQVLLFFLLLVIWHVLTSPTLLPPIYFAEANQAAFFFIVFFNVYQGVREVSPVVLANARMLGASPRQLLRHVYVPSAMSWVFASLHNSVGLAFVGAVVGEYLGS